MPQNLSRLCVGNSEDIDVKSKSLKEEKLKRLVILKIGLKSGRKGGKHNLKESMRYGKITRKSKEA